MDTNQVPSTEALEAALSRLQKLASHLDADLTVENLGMMSGSFGLAAVPTAARLSEKHSQLQAEKLQAFMAGSYKADKERIYAFFQKNPQLQTPVEISKAEHRELAFEQMKALVHQVGLKPLTYLMTDPAKYYHVFEAIGTIDLSLSIKMGVQYSLWGGSVVNLGTQKHKDKYAVAIETLEAPGCFAMTELHHGSNVQGVETTATYDIARQEFVIKTPNEGATKWWIGNAACHGKFATVFARLKLPSAKSHIDEDMGIHAFIVPIRSLEDHKVLSGVEIRDCGYKVGLNGVDNGALRFRNVRIPRENLLNRFGDVAADGTYTSPLPSASKRFAATLGELVGGRVGLAFGSVSVLKAASTIAIRYSLVRQQFGPPGQPEIAILDYQSQQLKLMPMLASCYAFYFASDYLVKRYAEMKMTHDEAIVADVHALSAGLKAHITAYTAKSLSVCREACGGHGYAAVNRFGALRNDHDIFLTFEGDNTVLLQQVAADLLKQYKEKFSGGALAVTWLYLRQQMSTYTSQTNPVATHRGSAEHLRDPGFQLNAFRYRTATLLHTAALRLRKHSARLGSFQAWNRCLNHLLTLAESHIESVILAKFIESYKRCQDPEARSALKTMCDLYALERIWKNIGSFRNEDYVAPSKAKSIQRQVELLCYEVRGMSEQLVDAFGIPDAMLRAPIGLKTGQYAEYSSVVGW